MAAHLQLGSCHVPSSFTQQNITVYTLTHNVLPVSSKSHATVYADVTRQAGFGPLAMQLSANC